MIFVFVPYYKKWHGYFDECLKRQTTEYYLIKFNRGDFGIGWSGACNHFLNTLKTFRGIDDDVICIMNNDIRFGGTLFAEGRGVRENEILIPAGCQVQIDWETKSVTTGGRLDTFPGRTFFMRATDFMRSGGFSRLLPHYLGDYDFGIRMIKRGMRVRVMKNGIQHADHPKNTNPWSNRGVNNPLAWTVFLLRHGRNRYFFRNLLKIWGELILN